MQRYVCLDNYLPVRYVYRKYRKNMIMSPSPNFKQSILLTIHYNLPYMLRLVPLSLTKFMIYV